MGTEATGREANLRADDLQEVVVTVDPQLRVVFWNRAGVETTGFSRESTLGRELKTLFDEESAQALDGLVDVLRGGATIPGVELRLQTRYGHGVDVEVTGYGEVSGGSLAGMTLVMRDMTLRNLLEERRWRVEQVFRTLVEHAPAVIYITDASGHIQFINTAVERVLGYSPRELRGRSLMEIVHPDDRHQAYWPLHERRTGARSTSAHQVRFLRKQGTVQRMELESVVFSLTSVGLYFSPSGEADLRFSGTQGIAQDVTEHEKLRELDEHLRTLIPICSSCRRIRTTGPGGEETWVRLEEYVREHSNAALSHTYCPECMRKIQES